MDSLITLLLAAGMYLLANRLGWLEVQKPGGLRRAGLAFVGAVLLSTLLVLAGMELGATPRAVWPGEALHLEWRAVAVLTLTGLLYALSAWRGRLEKPPWIADILLLAAAAGAGLLYLLPPFDSGQMIALIPGILWTWLVARMAASLNRTPQVTGGYLGLVGLTLWVLLHWRAPSAPSWTYAASAALAGAGLATIPVALRHSEFNAGWSAALAGGFLLAQIGTHGLLQSATFAMLALCLLAFGVPLLDISFYRLKGALHGREVEWEERRSRLHKALLARGISPAKVTALYLAMGLALCALGVLAALGLQPELPFWVLVVRTLGLFVLWAAGFILFFSLTRILMHRHPDEAVPDLVEAFGVRITPVSMEEAISRINGFIQSRRPHHVVTSDANAVLRAQQDEEYAGIIRRAALITPDGFGVLWGARLLNLPVYERVTGVDMVTRICALAAEHKYSIYILGSAPGVAATAAQKLAERYPGMRVAGTQHGYFKPEEEEIVVRQIRDAKPDVLFVAFGIPKQEKFIARHLEEMQVPVSLGVGGSFDVYSEKLKRAPDYIQRTGMEWLYRIWQEPWRWKRMSYVPRFMLLAIKVWLFGPKEQRGRTLTTTDDGSDWD